MARVGVSFELERFGWAGQGAVLEVAGRWRGPRVRRLGPAVLAVEADGRRRLAPSLVSGEARADPEPTLWRAEYRWDGGAAGGFELEVGANLIIELPAPQGSPPRGGRSGVETGPGRAELGAARRQIEADRAETARLREELVILRGEALEREQTREFLRLAQATAEAERRAVRAAREGAALQRAGAGADAQSKTAAESAREEAAALRLELERAREEAAGALREAEHAREDLVKAHAGAGVAREELAQRERERDAALAEVARLRDERSGLHAAHPRDAASGGSALSAITLPAPARRPAAGPPGSDSPTQELEDDATDTLVLESPRRRRPQQPHRERTVVVPHRTSPAPRRYAERPPKDSPALRAIAGVLLLLLAIVLVTVLVIVV